MQLLAKGKRAAKPSVTEHPTLEGDQQEPPPTKAKGKGKVVAKPPPVESPPPVCTATKVT
ncbi:hypothetical protein PM082_020048 [Marasmius tenuissimus]|nr:hypothetical protein PM082_020048 [Marasmius tenuissimus]